MDEQSTMMHRMPTRAELTAEEFSSLGLVASGFMSRTIPMSHQVHLIELGLIQAVMGGLMVTCWEDRRANLVLARRITLGNRFI
jgi:hypothetical protein